MIDQYVVIGHPVAHSLSPSIHQRFAAQCGQSMDYSKLEAPLAGFVKTVRDFQHRGGKGANVTIPFKEEAFHLADEASDLAAEAGAANTLLFQGDGSIYADNTDGVGFANDLTHNYGYHLQQKKILLLGAGGSARGLIRPLLEQNPASLAIASRTLQKALDLVAQFKNSDRVQAMPWDKIPSLPYDLIINCTSAGLSNETLELPSTIIDAHTWCYDLVYGKTTPFLLWAKRMGAAECLDGFGMLVEQAALSFKLWRGVYPDTKVVIAELRP